MTNNTFQENVNGVMVLPVEFEGGLSDEETFIGLDFSGNTYVGNHPNDVNIHTRTFPAFDKWKRVFMTNSTIVVRDSDGVFPDPVDVDLGPEENENAYELIEE